MTNVCLLIRQLRQRRFLMKSKMLVCGALAAAFTMSVAFSGCGNATRNEEDMGQVIATVDISKSENLESEGLSQYTSAIESEKNILKRDLVASFYNVGYSYVQSGYDSAEVFEMLVDALTTTSVVTQYATLKLISLKSEDENDDFSFSEYLSLSTEIERYEYLLEGEVSDESESNRVLLARYALYSSINSSLDSIEEDIINGDDDSSSSSDTRTTPSGAGEEIEDFLPLNDDGTLNYGIYTGYSDTGYSYLIGDSGIYEDDMLEGSTKATRRLAYASFLSSLKQNYLITEDDEDVRDVLSLSYIQEEYLSQLQQQVINEYYERYQAEQEALIETVDEDGVYTFLQERYEKDLADQSVSNSTASAFESSMSSLSDTSFILYAPATDGTDGGTYGFVYNILLPFSSSQSVNIDSSDTSAQYYFARMALLDNIIATDQRSAWFNGETDYSFNASEAGLDYYNGGDSKRVYLFFEENLTQTQRYQTLDKYAGKYTYNGTVSKNADGSYSLVPNRLTVDDVLNEVENYIEYIMGGDTVTIEKQDSYDVSSYTDYYTEETKDLPDSQKKIDYSRFVYAIGHVDLGDETTSLSSFLTNMFVEDSAAYKAMSAFNELQYAYTTDTSVLSEYIGYSVSAYDTSYIPEFEYAAQAAVAEGAGTIYVCAGDYGWHIIYVTATFDTAGGAVYGDVDWTAEYVLKDGTFQNMYYNWIKDTVLSDVTTTRRTLINELFGGDTTVTLYEDAYSDLLAL